MTQTTPQTELPLYPKISSIYNKILQLAIAIFLLVILLNLWVFSYENHQQATKKHFSAVSQQYLSQVVSASSFLLEKDRETLQHYFDEVALTPWIKGISYYDKTGQLVISSKERSSIIDLYGISLNKSNKSREFTTFVQELRKGTLQGYIRITIKNHSFTKAIENAIEENYGLIRLMMIIAVVIGFFLTRGLNRFSRQGYRGK